MRRMPAIMAGLSTVPKKAKELIITAVLSFIYVILFGIFRVVAALFDRKRLWPEKKPESYWGDADGYAPDTDECMRQS